MSVQFEKFKSCPSTRQKHLRVILRVFPSIRLKMYRGLEGFNSIFSVLDCLKEGYNDSPSFFDTISHCGVTFYAIIWTRKSNSTNCNYFLPKILTFLVNRRKLERKILKTQAKNSRSGRIFPHLRYQVMLQKSLLEGSPVLRWFSLPRVYGS